MRIFELRGLGLFKMFLSQTVYRYCIYVLSSSLLGVYSSLSIFECSYSTSIYRYVECLVGLDR